MQKTILKTTVGVLSSVGMLGMSQAVQAYDFDAGDVKASIYGYAQLNAVYDFDEDIGGSTQAGQFNSIDGSGAEGHFDADVLQSRLGFSAQHINGVKVVIEGDFRDDFRLRHAYGSYENWTIGKTWSNYNSWTGWTSTLDFDSLAGSPGVQDRIAQARYTTGDFSIALEKDYFPNISSSVAKKSSLPTLTARYESAVNDDVTFVVAGLVRHLSVDDGSTDASVLGYGAFTGVTVQLDGFSIQGAFNVSKGANAYLYRSGDNFGGTDAYLFNGDLETVTGYGGTIGVSVPTSSGSFNAAYGIAKMDLDDMANDVGVSATAHESNSNIFVNYQWNTTDHIMMGVELGYFDVDFYNGGSEDATRLMYTARYSF